MKKDIKCPKLRRKWRINPVEKVRQSKKIYNRAKAKKESNDAEKEYDSKGEAHFCML